MTYTTARLATTAIAAALALSATPLFAQEIPQPDPTVAPPASTTPDPLAAEPVATEPAEPAPVTTATEATASKPAPKAKAATRTVSTVRAPVRAAEPVATPAAPVATAEPADAAPIVDITPDAEMAPPAPVEPAATSQIDMDEALPIAGAGALALLGLTGAALALRRRRRRRDEIFAEEQWQAEEARAEPVPAEPRAPVMAAGSFAAAAAPRHDPVFADKPKTTLPEGFDLSRFGRHVQAAYRGPTPDNPSLSLKYRLRRASALDQRERIAGTAKVETQQAQAPAPRPMVHSGGSFMIGGASPKTVVRPDHSKVN